MLYIKRFETEKSYNEARIKEYKDPWTSSVELTGGTRADYNKGSINFNGYGYVDMGFPSGTLWATSNVGTTYYTMSGRYYAWGDISTKSNYNLSTYRFYDGTSFTKYNGTTGLAEVELELEDDIAHVYMGGDWCMPTVKQLRELVKYCDIEYLTTDPATGNSSALMQFTSKIDPTKQLFFYRGGQCSVANTYSAYGYTLYLRSASGQFDANQNYMNSYILRSGNNLSGNMFVTVEFSSAYTGYSVRGVINR